jgi:hypothetical protein
VSAPGTLEHAQPQTFQFTHLSPQSNGVTGMIHDLLLSVFTGVGIGIGIIVLVTIIDLWSER